MTGPFQQVLRGDSPPAPPIWLMRQAGRFQASYRRRRERHTFEELCTRPELAAEVASAAIREFDLDAAILFSDLLFPLRALGMSLSYANGAPELDGPITGARVAAFRDVEEAAARLRFQADAIAETRARLPARTGLIGFVGGPWTLFVYAVEGTHAGALARAKSSPQLYRDFASRVVPVLERAIDMQLRAGADLVMVFDTAAGELPPQCFGRLSPDLQALARVQPGRVGYYAKGLHPAQLDVSEIGGPAWAGVGYDARWDLAPLVAARAETGRQGFVHGNFDPALLLLPEDALVGAVRDYLAPFEMLPAAARRPWICGLGHGVLPDTPEESVRAFVRIVRETFA